MYCKILQVESGIGPTKAVRRIGRGFTGRTGTANALTINGQFPPQAASEEFANLLSASNPFAHWLARLAQQQNAFGTIEQRPYVHDGAWEALIASVGLVEQGFEVCVVKDGVAGPRHPVWGDGYKAAMTNYQFLAHAVLSTDEAVSSMR